MPNSVIAFTSGLFSSRVVRSVRNARSAGEWNRLRNTVSVSFALTIAFFQLSCTGDSFDDTIRVPSCTPSAPSANAATILAPSTKPPAAMIGTDTFDRTSGSSTIVATSLGFLKPPPSPPSTINPSTPHSTAFSAADRLGTTWNTVSPARFQLIGISLRAAGGGGHELHALIDDELRDAGIAHERLRDVHAERFVGERGASS